MASPNSTKVQIKSNWVMLITTAIMLIIGLLCASYWFGYARYFESTNNAYLQGDITTIRPKVSGYIAKSFVSDNQKVKKGDLLVELDARDYVTELEQAKAHLAVSKSSIDNLVAQKTLQKSHILQADSRVDSAKAEYQRSTQQVRRSRSLLTKNYASQDEVDDMLAQQKVALAELNEANASLVSAHDQLLVIDSDIHQAEASVVESEVDVDQAELNLSYTKIYAPVDGIVGKRSVRQGLLVQAGSPLLSLVPTGNIWVEANFKETQLVGIHQGQKVTIEFDAFPDQRLIGIVDSFSPATGAKFALLPPENATGNFTKIVQRVPVKISIPDKQTLKGRLLPGLSVVTTIDTRG
ncbi:HlyD family secretion protein [Vibrio pectenicida]|uniref:HlyD family secretion protein n=1 Tax=Vibrio pectenicida TaxID=62763 RepID=UPI003B99F714